MRLLALPALFLTLFLPGTAGAEGSALFRLLLRPSARILFEGEGAAALEVVLARMGGPIRDFRGADYYRFRRRFAEPERELLEESLARIDGKLIGEIRAGRVTDERALLRRLAREELVPPFTSTFEGDIHDFLLARAANPYRSSRELFLGYGGTLAEVVRAIEEGRSLRGLVAPGVNLGEITASHLLLRPLDLAGAELRFAQAESTRILAGAILRRANLSYGTFFGSDFVHATMVRVRAAGAEFRAAKFNGADLSHGDFRGADFRGADLEYVRSLEGAELTGARFDELTRLPFSHREARARGMVFEAAG